MSQTGVEKAGCGYFAEGLIRALAETDRVNNYILYPAVGDHFWDPKCSANAFDCDQPNFERLRAPRDFDAARSLWSSPGTELETVLGSPDVFHVNNFFCPSGLRRAKLVYTLYDLSFLHEPDWTTESNRLGCFKGMFAASTRADGMIAISKFTRDEFLGTFPHYPRDRVKVIYPGSRFEARTELARPERFRMLQPERFWLCVGTIEPRKNHVRLIEAYAQLKPKLKTQMPLVLAGGKGWLMDDLQRRLWDLNLGPGEVIVTGYVEDSELRWLYENCFCFVYPSLFEGFGLPVLEAMKLGAAVISSNTSSIPEIIGTSGIQVNPYMTDELEHAMRRVADEENVRDRLRAEAQETARIFSWAHSAKVVLEFYEDILRARTVESSVVNLTAGA